MSILKVCDPHKSHKKHLSNKSKQSKISTNQPTNQQIEKGGLTLCHFETKVKALKLSCVKDSFQIMS